MSNLFYMSKIYFIKQMLILAVLLVCGFVSAQV